MLHSNKLHYDWTFLAIILLKDSYGMKKYDNCSDNQIFPKKETYFKFKLLIVRKAGHLSV